MGRSFFVVAYFIILFYSRFIVQKARFTLLVVHYSKGVFFFFSQERAGSASLIHDKVLQCIDST